MTAKRKSTVDEIRARFDADVERFSDLSGGNHAQVDSVWSLDLIAEGAASLSPNAKRMLDIGCGAGNYTLKILERLPNLDVTLLDLSRPMLDRAFERVTAATKGEVTTIQSDLREASLGGSQFDLIVASAVLHHLRSDDEWDAVFQKLRHALTAGGTLWVYDLVDYEMPEVARLLTDRYSKLLEEKGGPEYRQKVFDYIDDEDTPRPLTFQVNALRRAGFANVDILHSNTCFATYVARK